VGICTAETKTREGDDLSAAEGLRPTAVGAASARDGGSSKGGCGVQQ